jgi:hypothetical protein
VGAICLKNGNILPFLGVLGSNSAHTYCKTVQVGHLPTYFLKLLWKGKKSIYKEFCPQSGQVAKKEVFGHCPRILYMGYNRRDEMCVLKRIL